MSDLLATFSDGENINKDVCLLVDIETTTKQCAEQCDLSWIYDSHAVFDLYSVIFDNEIYAKEVQVKGTEISKILLLPMFF